MLLYISTWLSLKLLAFWFKFYPWHFHPRKSLFRANYWVHNSNQQTCHTCEHLSPWQRALNIITLFTGWTPDQIVLRVVRGRATSVDLCHGYKGLHRSKIPKGSAFGNLRLPNISQVCFQLKWCGLANGVSWDQTHSQGLWSPPRNLSVHRRNACFCIAITCCRTFLASSRDPRVEANWLKLFLLSWTNFALLTKITRSVVSTTR